jgi:16S rRNA (guanine1516-N2)-methyltransferase
MLMLNLPEIAFELCDHPDKNRMRQLASELALPLLEESDKPTQSFAFILRASAHGLALVDNHAGAGQAGQVGMTAPTRVDFLDASLQYRLRTSGKRQGLGKAVGLDKLPAHKTLSVLDATAGLGKDALVLAHFGCAVTLLERSPLIHALLNEGLLTATQQADAAMQSCLARMRLYQAEARQWFAQIAAGDKPRPDVIYLDPMFPPKNHSAKSKKDIALLHTLLGAEVDLPSLLLAALPCAQYRVVLKRPENKLADDLPKPHLVVEGKASAFAVYVNSSFSNMR